MSFEGLKKWQATMWGSAPFERIAQTLEDMHENVVQAMNAIPGQRWLDIGCGTGELAFKAAATGAEVTACDLAPALVRTARRQAVERGSVVAFDIGDAESLAYLDAAFDVVTSSVGVIYAPDHARVAAELARVCRPGGRLGLTTWSSDGSCGEFMEIVRKYAPQRATGAGDMSEWGQTAYCGQRLGDSFELTITTQNTPLYGKDGEELWTLISDGFGLIQTLLAYLPAERGQQFRDEMVAYLGRERTPEGVRLDRDYHLVVGRRKT